MENNEHSHQNKKSEGKIIKLSDKGWGFILSPQYQFTRIFFHWTALQQNTLNFADLKVGMKVKFFTQRYPDSGVHAYKIEVINSEDGHINGFTIHSGSRSYKS